MSNTQHCSYQLSFWKAVSLGDLKTAKILIERFNIETNEINENNCEIKGCNSLHLAIIKICKWNLPEDEELAYSFITDFITLLLDNEADIFEKCQYKGTFFIETGNATTNIFYPEGQDSLGITLNFISITMGFPFNKFRKRYEIVRYILLDHVVKKKCFRKGLMTKRCSLLDDISESSMQDKFTDIKLVSQGEKFPCHKFILASRSSVFKAMLCNNNFKESSLGEIEIKETEPTALCLFVNFLYSDTVSKNILSDDFLLCCDLLLLSDRYDVEILKIMCSEIIAFNHLSKENFVKILEISEKSNSKKLLESAIFYSGKCLSEMVKTNEYDNLNSETAKKILKYIISTGLTDFLKEIKDEEEHKEETEEEIGEIDEDDNI